MTHIYIDPPPSKDALNLWGLFVLGMAIGAVICAVAWWFWTAPLPVASHVCEVEKTKNGTACLCREVSP